MQTHNTRELVLNYRVNLERKAIWLATKPGTKKWIVGGSGREIGEQLS